MRTLYPCSLALCCALSLLIPLRADEGPKGGPEEFKFLKYRLIGPAAGGRVCRVAGVPGDPRTAYAATAAGGIWKTTDGGLVWKPVFDDQPVASVGSIAVAPSDPNVIYAGTGEANIRGNVATGNGIYKSTDAGRTWKQVWKQQGQIGQMIVHPTNPNIAFAAVLGHAFGPNRERGVYRTTDGGRTWRQVLAKDENTGASAVCFDVTNPRILFAGLWQARRRPWELTSGGPGSGLNRSDDGGETWKQLTHSKTPGEHWGKGLPEGTWGKVGVAVAPSDGRRVYALIEAEDGGLFRSDDGGENWKHVNNHHVLGQRAWYYSTLTIDPRDPDVIWVPQVRLVRSIDGGLTFQAVKGPHHGDHHDIWIDPRDPRRILNCNDGGVDLSSDGGRTWFAPHLPLSQFYHVAVDNREPYFVSGCMQDLGSACGPSNSLSAGGIRLADWYDVGGGEAGHTAHDPTDYHIVYAGEYGGIITRFDLRTHQARNVSSYPANPSGHGAADMKYRFNWTAPIAISPHEPHAVYHGGNVLFKTTDGGKTWSRISGDLTRNDRTKQQWSGGPLTGDNTGAEYYCTIFAIAESPKQKDLLWVGSDDGMVHVSENGGRDWADVTKNMPGLPEWATVSCIEPSPFDAGTAYVVVDAHRLDDFHPYLYRTTDKGKTWKSLTADLPQDVHLHAVREDPKRKGLLYVGTENGVSFSRDDGATWRELKLNFPTTPVHDLVVKGNDLVIGTHGRSIWIFDDLTPIRNWSSEVAKEAVHFFPTQPARRYRLHGEPGGRAEGANPAIGAYLTYSLKQKPKGPVTLEILDADGKRVTLLKSKEDEDDKKTRSERRTAVEKSKWQDPDEREPYKKPVLTTEPGVNRVVWDLRYAGAEMIPGAKVDAGEPDQGPLVTPGTYTLRLSVEGQTYPGKVEVLLDTRERFVKAGQVDAKPEPQSDPLQEIAEADLDGQLRLTLRVRDDIDRVTQMVARLRGLRRQLAERNDLLKDQEKMKGLREDSNKLIATLDKLEAKLHNPDAEVVYDILAQRGGAQLYSQLAFLFESLKDGDGAPTQGVRDQALELAGELEQCGRQFEMLSDEVTKLNEQATKLGVPGVLVPPVPEKKD